MTNSQVRDAIRIESERGKESLRAAELLLAAGLFADAVSRAYYAALHFARALLLTTGEEPKTHSGVLRTLSRDFVRTGRVSPETARLLSGLEKERSDADYAAEIVFTQQSAADEVANAAKFIDEITALLVADGWLAPWR